MRVENGLSLTTEAVESVVIQPHTFSNGGARRLVLVDTPGFEADDVKDASVLKSINKWVASRYRCVKS